MNERERRAFTALTGHPMEEGHYFGAIDNFCEFLVDAYNDGPDGKKYEMFIETLKGKLPKDIFDDVFGGF